MADVPVGFGEGPLPEIPNLKSTALDALAKETGLPKMDLMRRAVQVLSTAHRERLNPQTDASA